MWSAWNWFSSMIIVAATLHLDTWSPDSYKVSRVICCSSHELCSSLSCVFSYVPQLIYISVIRCGLHWYFSGAPFDSRQGHGGLFVWRRYKKSEVALSRCFMNPRPSHLIASSERKWSRWNSDEEISLPTFEMRILLITVWFARGFCSWSNLVTGYIMFRKMKRGSFYGNLYFATTMHDWMKCIKLQHTICGRYCSDVPYLWRSFFLWDCHSRGRLPRYPQKLHFYTTGRRRNVFREHDGARLPLLTFSFETLTYHI